MSEPFIGQIQMWGTNFAPRGWALCSGTTIPISQNTALFAILGTTYGGDGRTSMGLPNMQGRMPLHVGGRSGVGPGLSVHQLGEQAGTVAQTLSNSQMPNHNHGEIYGQNGKVISDSATPENTLVGFRESNGNIANYQSVKGNTFMSDRAISRVGLSQAHENTQPYITLNFCIAMIGIFPPHN